MQNMTAEQTAEQTALNTLNAQLGLPASTVAAEGEELVVIVERCEHVSKGAGHRCRLDAGHDGGHVFARRTQAAAPTPRIWW